MKNRKVHALVAGIAAVMTAALMLAFVVAPRTGRAQQVNVAFWIANEQIDAAAVDFAIPMGPSRSSSVELCGGTGNCPSGCPKPVQDWVFHLKGGGTRRIRDIVMSVEVRPGSKARQFTAGSSCSVADPDNPGAMIVWYKFVATSVD